MIKKVFALTFIFGCTSVAWMILGGSVRVRSNEQNYKLRGSVGQLWGQPQTQISPTIYYEKEYDLINEKEINGKVEREAIKRKEKIPVSLSSSQIEAFIGLKHRKKGLLWYSTYSCDFKGIYKIVNETKEEKEFKFNYQFPAARAIYDDFTVYLDKKEISEISPENGLLQINVKLKPKEAREVVVKYKTQGLDDWWYKLGDSVSRIRNFSMDIYTDFDNIDFPENSMSPTFKDKTSNGWKLSWKFKNLVSDIQIGVKMPEKLNPGPFVGDVTFFAPVSLFLFFFLLFIITSIKKIKIHPMNYFFISGAFFSFHLLLAYLVDHLSIHLSFIICSIVSVFLVISYMRLVVGLKFALLEVGISQIVFLILFSYSFFFKGFTGLTITIACIITLFIIMQLTGKIDWQEISKEMRN